MKQTDVQTYRHAFPSISHYIRYKWFLESICALFSHLIIIIVIIIIVIIIIIIISL